MKSFFHDMASRYRGADLVVCRAGATTVAELTAMGKAALFIPFPFATDNHQEHNARRLVDRGAATMILERDLTGSVAGRAIGCVGRRTAKIGRKKWRITCQKRWASPMRPKPSWMTVTNLMDAAS